MPSRTPEATPSPPRQPPALVLGSTSVYRMRLLERLRLPFTVAASDVDETPLPGEDAAALAQRLALTKAKAVARQHPGAVVLGADQTAELLAEPWGAAGADAKAPANDTGTPAPPSLIGKPGDLAGARAQLRQMSGRRVRFHSAVAAVCPATGFETTETSRITVHMRRLSPADIDRYLALDEPWDCAGSAKVESLGVALAERIDSDDPTALEGLPLIATCRMLRAAGLDPLHWAR